MIFLHHFLAIILIVIAAIASVKTKKLTTAGGFAGGLSAVFIYAGAAYTGIAMLAVFFISGTLATGWKKKEKQSSKSDEDVSERRRASQVLANGGVAAVTGMLLYFFPSQANLWRLMMTAALASATADTLSSELGIVYGRRFYNIITWKRDQKGLDGVISLEGTLMGCGGSFLIAAVYALGFGWGVNVLLIVIAGTIGNLSDSLLGATLERKHYISNDAVNFLNTLIAAITAWLLYSMC